MNLLFGGVMGAMITMSMLLLASGGQMMNRLLVRLGLFVALLVMAMAVGFLHHGTELVVSPVGAAAFAGGVLVCLAVDYGIGRVLSQRR